MALAAPTVGGPDADAGALARARAHRHRAIPIDRSAGRRRRSAPRRSQSFIAEANDAFPALQADSRGRHARAPRRRAGGRGPDGAPELRPVPAIWDHASEAAEGAFTVVGVKYTTARARRRARGECRSASGSAARLAPSRTATTVLPGAGIADHEALAIETARALNLELPLPLIRHLIARYAERAAEIVRLIGERPDLLAPLSPDVPTIRAEVLHVIRKEQATRLSDILIRRTGLGSKGHPPDAAIRAAAVLAAAELRLGRAAHQRRDPASAGVLYILRGRC